MDKAVELLQAAVKRSTDQVYALHLLERVSRNLGGNPERADEYARQAASEQVVADGYIAALKLLQDHPEPPVCATCDGSGYAVRMDGSDDGPCQTCSGDGTAPAADEQPASWHCTATTYRGNRRCRNRAEPGTDRCAFHPHGQ